jgi:GTP-dependent phosphoenolpyruvate carboxykinase
MPRIMGEMKLEKIRQDIPKKRSKVMKETWQKRKAKPHVLLKRNLQDQVNRIGNRHFASKNLHEVTRLQNAHDYAEARRIMKDLLEQAMSGTFVPIDVQIATLIKPLETQPTKE